MLYLGEFHLCLKKHVFCGYGRECPLSIRSYLLYLIKCISYAYLLYLTAFVFICSVNYYQFFYQFVLQLLRKSCQNLLTLTVYLSIFLQSSVMSVFHVLGFTISGSLHFFVYTQVSMWYCISSVLQTFKNISYNAGLLVNNSLSFCLSKIKCSVYFHFGR